MHIIKLWSQNRARDCKISWQNKFRSDINVRGEWKKWKWNCWFFPPFSLFPHLIEIKLHIKIMSYSEKREKIIFFFFPKNCTCTLFLGNYSLHKSLISWNLTFHMRPKSWYHENWRFKMRIVYSIPIRTIPLDNESAKLARGGSRNFRAEIGDLCVYAEGSANEIRCSEAD